MLLEPALAPQTDEKAWTLVELSLPSQEPGAGMRRVQRVVVDRNDSLMYFDEDLGPSESFTAPLFQIPSLWVHSVGELRDIAEQERLGSKYWQNYMEENPSNLIDEFARQYEAADKFLKSQSTFGPGISIQRNH